MVAVCALKPVVQLTPIGANRLQSDRYRHPNPDRVAYEVQGLHHQGLNHSVHLKSSQVINSYLESEVHMGRVAGPFLEPPLPCLHMSRFGVLPKRKQRGKERLILDLSNPEGHSVKGGNASEEYSLEYMKVDHCRYHEYGSGFSNR